MNKIVLTLSLAVLIIGTALSVFIIKYKPAPKTEISKKAVHPMLPINGITLTGVTADNANKMVMDFYNETRSSHRQTAIWFSRRLLDTLVKKLSDEEATSGANGGIRIYAAKEPGNIPGILNNTVIIVSTVDDAAGNHIDNFIHTNFDYTKIPASDISKDWTGDDGALLFKGTSPGSLTTCPTGATDINAIPPDKAYKYVQEFHKIDNQGLNTMSEWFSLDVLRFLKAGLDVIKTPLKTPDGVRLYFAKNLDAPHVNRHCFILVPTVTDKTIPNHPIPHKDDFACYKSLTLEKLKNRLKGNAEENGEECPNNCDGTALPTN